MRIVLIVSLAEIVQARLSILILLEPVLGAFAMAGELHVAFLALAGQRSMLQPAESLLLFAIKHVDERLLPDVSQLVFRKYKVVAGIYIAIVFHHACMTALLGVGADAWQHPHPVGKCAVEDFHKGLTHIVAHPVVEDGAEEVAPLLRGNGSICKRNLPVVGKTRQGATVFMFLSRSTIGVNCKYWQPLSLKK